MNSDKSRGAWVYGDLIVYELPLLYGEEGKAWTKEDFVACVPEIWTFWAPSRTSIQRIGLARSATHARHVLIATFKVRK